MKSMSKFVNKHFQSKHFRRRKSRLIAIAFCGAIMLSSVLYWRAQYIQAAEYVPFPVRMYNRIPVEMQSSKYQLQTQEISPAVR